MIYTNDGTWLLYIFWNLFIWMTGMYFSLCSHNCIIDWYIVKSMHFFTGHNPGYYRPHLILGRNLLYTGVFNSAERSIDSIVKYFWKGADFWCTKCPAPAPFMDHYHAIFYNLWPVPINVLSARVSLDLVLRFQNQRETHNCLLISQEVIMNQPLNIVLSWAECNFQMLHFAR